MSFQTVYLELGRTADFPEGSSNRGYEIVVPIDTDGHLDVDAWRANRAKCTVRRFWPGEPDREGELIHTRHRTWAISYEPGEDDDCPFFHLESHLLTEDDYVTITEEDGQARPYRIARIR